jgi:hypothetical protein
MAQNSEIYRALRLALEEIHHPGAARPLDLTAILEAAMKEERDRPEPAPAGWTHAETSAPDDPTQACARFDHRYRRVNGCWQCEFCGDPMANAEQQPTPAAKAVDLFVATEQQDLPLPDLLAAILRRAERAKSYGRIMMTSKDSCIDDVVRLATRALLLANDQRSA